MKSDFLNWLKCIITQLRPACKPLSKRPERIIFQIVKVPRRMKKKSDCLNWLKYIISQLCRRFVNLF